MYKKMIERIIRNKVECWLMDRVEHYFFCEVTTISCFKENGDIGFKATVENETTSDYTIVGSVDERGAHLYGFWHYNDFTPID